MTAETPSVSRAKSAGSDTMNTMKAIRLHRLRGPEAPIHEDVPIPALRPGDALVRVHVAGISPAEFTWHLYETADGRRRLPKILSHEVSGAVAAVAPDVRDVAVRSPGQARPMNAGSGSTRGGKLVLAVAGN